MNSKNAFIKITFPYFVKKKAPISRIESYLSYNISYYGKLISNKYECKIKIKIPLITCCPCSKLISKYGAHNQRSIVSVMLNIKKDISINSLISQIESQASYDVYSLIKRMDEKYITEKSYENPKFVEDIVRDISIIINKNNAIKSYKVLSENIESIHNHTAYAYIER